MSHQNNITRIKAVSNALGELKDQVVFVGGATISLYLGRQIQNFPNKKGKTIDLSFIS